MVRHSDQGEGLAGRTFAGDDATIPQGTSIGRARRDESVDLEPGYNVRSICSQEGPMNNQTFFQQTLTEEFDRFHNVIAALPGDSLDFKHDPKSRSAGDIVGHLMGHIDDMIELLDAGVIHHRMQVPFANLGGAVKGFDDSYRTLLTKLNGVSDDTWTKVGDFRVGENYSFQAPVQALMWMLFLDAVHHRGQLSTCIRPMGGKVPSIYGPSADTAVGAP